MQVIDGGRFYDWLADHDLEMLLCSDQRVVTRREFEALFRQYVAELTSD